jgi:hypothetical protein
VSTPQSMAQEKQQAIKEAGGDDTASSGEEVLRFLRTRKIA